MRKMAIVNEDDVGEDYAMAAIMTVTMR